MNEPGRVVANGAPQTVPSPCFPEKAAGGPGPAAPCTHVVAQRWLGLNKIHATNAKEKGRGGVDTTTNPR